MQENKTDLTYIKELFDGQIAHQYVLGNTTAKQRIAKLNKLHKCILSYQEEIRQALWNDFKKPAAEVDLTEIYICTSEIKFAKANIKKWMAPQSVSTPISLLGSSSWYTYEPKGVCLIISPWNYPFNLTLGPLISAVAAGNAVMVKPSEFTPHTSAIMVKIIEEVFDKNEVAVCLGAVPESTYLLSLPFNHIFFTGSPQVGKIVMSAAAKHLASVTLELGGKSPTIVDETASIKTSAKRIAWGKFSNNGQICLAPDYLFVHESVKDELVANLKERLIEFYGEDPKNSKDYMRIINAHHLDRLKSTLDNAIEGGAKIETGGLSDRSQDFIEPTIVTNVSYDSDLMTKEIFGPILPIIAYKSLDDVITHIKKGEKPLALYIYSKSKKNIQLISENTRAGTTCINNNNVHFSNHHLPFGGSNNSGIGKSGGKYGFEAFSNARAYYQQHIPGAIELLMPPYTKLKMKIIQLTLKWL